MANIKRYLDKIRTAIYGKEVRGSLADGLEAINNETEDATEVAVNVEQRQDAVEQQFDDVLNEWTDDKPISNEETIAARTNRNTNENYGTIGQRLDAENKKVNAQLAQKAEKQDVFTKGETYNRGQVDEKTWNMKNMGQDVKEAMTGGSVAVVGEDAVDTVNLKNNAALFEKRSRLGERASLICAEGVPNFILTSERRAVVFPIGTTFYSGKERFTLSDSIDVEFSLNEINFYLFINIKTGEFRVFDRNYQVANLHENELYVASLSILGTIIRNIDIASDYNVNGELVSRLSNGSISTNHLQSNAATSDKRTRLGERAAIICLEGIPNIDIRSMTLTFSAATRFYSGKNQYQVSGEAKLDLPQNRQHHFIFLDFETGYFTVLNLIGQLSNLKESHVYIATISFSADYETLRSVDIGCDYSLNGKIVSRFEATDGDSSGEKDYYLQEPIPIRWYEAPEVEGYEAPDHYSDEVSLEDIYDVFDNHALTHPDYVTKTFFGNDASDTYPVNMYEYNPLTPEINRFTKKLPKLIITANIHGEEKASAITLRNFINDMVSNWRANPLLEWIRFNLHLIIVPINNPYGFVHQQKKNANGVDLNRNFSHNWDLMGDENPGDKLYKGPHPFSEVETQYIRDIILNNLDALAFYDYHMNGTSGATYDDMFWTILKTYSGGDGIQVAFQSTLNKLTREGQKRYGIPEDSGFIGHATYSDPSNSPTYAFSLGVPSATIECTRKIVGEENVYSAKSLQLGTEYIGNKILNTARNLIA